jgi:branched-chain amino acid transport system permease protein
MSLSKIISPLIVFVILAILPISLPSYYIGLVILMFIFAIFAMSLNILLGYGGLPSLGHAACFGVGAYTFGCLAVKVHCNFWVGATAGLVLSLCVAAGFGLLALRTRGVYFLMITLALSQLLWGIAFKWTSVTNGDDGLSGIPRPDLLFTPVNLSDTTAFYYFTLIFFMISAAAIYVLVQSPFGLALKGIRDSETRMRALGYNTWLYQYVAFITAGFFAAIAGILNVCYHGFVGPGDLHLVTSAKVLLMVILGGTGTFWGPIIGAFGLVFMENFISGYTEHWLLVLGSIYILVILFAPHGIYSPIRRRIQTWLTP